MENRTRTSKNKEPKPDDGTRTMMDDDANEYDSNNNNNDRNDTDTISIAFSNVPNDEEDEVAKGDVNHNDVVVVDHVVVDKMDVRNKEDDSNNIGQDDDDDSADGDDWTGHEIMDQVTTWQSQRQQEETQVDDELADERRRQSRHRRRRSRQRRRRQQEQPQQQQQEQTLRPGAYAVSVVATSSSRPGRNRNGNRPLDEEEEEEMEFHNIVPNNTVDMVEATSIADGGGYVVAIAKEYDPTANPSWYQNRRFRLYGTLGLVLLVVGFCVIVFVSWEYIGRNPKNQVEDMLPTIAPTTYRESIGIKEQIESLIPTDKLYDAESSHYMALQWILHDDPRQLQSDDPLLIQRYILVYLYFSTTQRGQSSWTDCNPPHPDTQEDSICMYTTPVDLITYPSVRWLTPEQECTWHGIQCDSLNQTTRIGLCKFVCIFWLTLSHWSSIFCIDPLFLSVPKLTFFFLFFAVDWNLSHPLV